jgi:translocation and assembly module TamB
MTRKRVALITAISLAALVVLVVATGVLVLRSSWFYEKVRERMIATIETATGGRAELGAYRFDWKRLRAEVVGLVLHGTEPAGKPPLFRAASVTAGLKIISLLGRKVDIQTLDVIDPRVYLIVFPDGHTNVPEPRLKSNAKRTPIETLLNLAIGRFSLQNGLFEVEARGKTPFDVSGRNLDAKFQYELAGPRYRGNFSIQPLDLRWGGHTPVPLGVTMAVALERNRIGITSAQWVTGGSSVEFSGTIDDLVSPRGSFQYQANASLADAARIFALRGLERGTAQARGAAEWRGPEDFSVTGNLHAFGVDFGQDTVRLRGFRADGALRAGPKGVDLNGIRISGASSYEGNSFPVEGRLAAVTLRNNDLDFRGAALSLLGGTFQGDGAIQAFSRFRVTGEISGLEAKRAVAVYNSRQQLPWNSLVSGPVTIEGSLHQKSDLRVSANVTLAPAPGGPPVRGQVAASYNSLSGALDLGASTVSLPSSRVEVSGSLGRQMKVHLETRDLNDFLPVLGERAASLPVKLEGGAILFDGTVTGQTDNPQIAGRTSLTRFSFSGESFDLLQADVNASPQAVRLQNAVAARGTLRAQFQGVLGLHNWKADGASAIAASGNIRNASVTELVAALHQKNVPATGTATATGQIAGTLGNPQVTGDVELAKGSIHSEPFDRLTARVNYSGTTLAAASGQLTAGAKQVRFEGSFDHAPAGFETGRLRFQAQTNTMPLEQIQTLEDARPGVKGSVQVATNGAVDLAPGSFRIADLHADVTARGLQLAGQPLGDAHLTAASAGPLLRVALDSNFVNSMIQGRGEWRLEGDYPGSGTVDFSNLNLEQLRQWVAPDKPAAPFQLTGFAEGQLRVDGPALKPQLMKAELRIPKLDIARAPGDQFALHNSGPIVATMANSVVTIESARLMGRATDLTLGGRLLLGQRNPLDLRVNGRIDVAVLQDFYPDLTSSGAMVVDAGVRGPFNAPQVNGRLEVQNAALNYVDFPNGLANANGVVVFTGDRATIETLTGETGGGKVQLSGFAGYGGGQTIFRIQANAAGVRVRYPEGISTVANADLNLTGTADRSMMAGTITILRTGLNLQSDFSNLLAKSAEPVRTPSSRSGLLGGLNFDVQIETAPDIQFESALMQGVQADATLRLRGTATNPALLGRINITQGQVNFFGTKYIINQGSVSFFNPIKIEPVLDIDLETKARGIDITLTVSGPLNKLNVTPRSDPPLQFNEIVALLATGRTPNSDITLLAQQGAAPQPMQQSAATALLGQVIANPVSGRLQRFFGISKVRIDPTITGIQYNPQARLTLEQQVTPDITFTYITNVTSANPQVVSMEWAVNRKWSVVAQREENGLFGLDFFYKRRFK